MFAFGEAFNSAVGMCTFCGQKDWKAHGTHTMQSRIRLFLGRFLEGELSKMMLCKHCTKRKNDWEVGTSIAPSETPNHFRTWMICETDEEGFPWKTRCEKYESSAD